MPVRQLLDESGSIFGYGLSVHQGPHEGAGQASGQAALLIDFGGVLTTSVFDAFSAVSSRLYGDPSLITRLLSSDRESSRLLVEHECGRITEAEFEFGFCERLRAHGVSDAQPAGIAREVQTEMRPDHAMLAGVSELRQRGVPVAVVSNAFGDDCYDGFDLAAIADAVVISSEVGIRKPSRGIYAIACERLEVRPSAAVMVDDLPHNLVGAERLGIRGLHHRDAATSLPLLREWLSGSATSREAPQGA